ncbi:hypothetical protein [Duganella radicis]|uniref:Uncharacterized protein n=1 Tax=Duganella radicis TaxID=551988 RepID=A0A6L6PGX2_9BURK|nr:hypothetical protein [Duganella radicis]MTV38224.1 hypothetical protein [Duganella radicis]
MKLPCAILLAATAGTALAADEVVFREPFTLRLHVDKEHYAEYPIGKVPFVHNGAVYLYKGDSFGLRVQVEDGTVKSLAYVADGSTADNFESWPHPIAQLVLHKLKVQM